MGYSEVHCTLCGVSFNICRIRTPNEPREHAWNYYGRDKPGTTFIVIDDQAHFEDGCASTYCDYPGREGCMIAFREDEALRSRGLRGARRGVGDEIWDEIVFKGLGGERVDLSADEDGDEDWVPWGTSGGEDEMDDEEMEYESGSPTESCGEDADVEMEENDESEYHAWTERVVASAHLDVYGYPCDSNDLAKIRAFERMRCLAEELRAKVPTEVRLPLYVPLESIREPLRSEFEQGKHDVFSVTQGEKKMVTPIWENPLNALGPETECWEHLAGPDCRSTRGYLGSHISPEEMLNCNVAQAILSRDINASWEADSTDEDWEGKGKPGWYLTGLVDSMDSRGGMNDAYPDRHPDRIQRWFQMDNICWNNGGTETMAMTFHPTCLEVFKRVSLRRRGRFDIHALGNWWRGCTDYEYIKNIPRAKDVTEGANLWWEHNVGAEYLATNPCFVPPLEKILASSKKVETSNARPPAEPSPFSTLPVEIQRSIMSYLDMVDVASLSIACPDLRDAAEGVLQSTLLHDMPYVWELWCNMPYSKWTGTTAAAIKAGIEAFDNQETEVARVLGILEEEGYHDQRAMYKQYWDDNREERRKESRISLQEKPADFIDTGKLDLSELVLRLNRARTNGELKGLVNRERIWTDCNMILDRIEELQEEGKIPPSQVH